MVQLARSRLTCIATGKSFWASGGKNTSTAFFGKGWFPVGGVPTSMMCNCRGGGKQRNKRWDTHKQRMLNPNDYWCQPVTFPPAWPLTAKQKRVDSSVLPSILNWAKLAAWPSMGWETFLSTEYSCMAPTTRFCWKGKPIIQYNLRNRRIIGLFQNKNLLNQYCDDDTR